LRISNAFALGLSPKKIQFFLLHVRLRFSQNPRKSGLSGSLGRHRPGQARSKNFQKSEKKACQPSKTPVILTAKPNQTIGETND
jgi:hypothetical protein